MFIAHLPAGYLLGRGAQRMRPDLPLWPAIFGSIAPDLDMLYFYFVDRGQTHHHEFITHRPAFWLSLAILSFLVRKPTWRRACVLFFIAGFLHMGLDSMVGHIAWGWPVSDRGFHLITVEPTQNHWILSFLLHPSFLVEIAILAAAIWVWGNNRPRTTTKGPR